MQLYAHNVKGEKISIHSAARGIDYFCLECQGRLRARWGSSTSAHFYHLGASNHCRQASKSETHLFLQRSIQQQIGVSKTVEEMRFGAIGRVADVAWPEKKCVFEVQCSPIHRELVEARTKDYESIGWDVVWILLDTTFNKTKLTGAELFLQTKTHYYTDGRAIYDLCHLIANGRKKEGLKRAPLEIASLDIVPKGQLAKIEPKLLRRRSVAWKFFAKGDHLWNTLYGQDEEWLSQVQKIKRQEAKEKLRALVRPILLTFRSLWHFILERSCS